MSAILYILLTIAFLALFGLTVWLLTIVFYKREDARDAPIDLNFISAVDSGCFIGSEVSSISGKDGRHVVEISPRDVDVFKSDKKIEHVKVIVDKNKICVFPKGSLSKDRNVNIFLPKCASDLPESVKQSILGAGIMLATELQNCANSEISSLAEGHLRKDEILKKIGNAEVSKQYLQLQDELFKDMMKRAADAKNPERANQMLGMNQPPR